jgi:hypothetical protein
MPGEDDEKRAQVELMGRPEVKAMLDAFRPTRPFPCDCAKYNDPGTPTALLWHKRWAIVGYSRHWPYRVYGWVCYSVQENRGSA